MEIGHDILNSLKYSHVTHKTLNRDFHFHDGYEVFFVANGEINYFVEKKVFNLKYGDLIFVNNGEFHKYSSTASQNFEKLSLGFGLPLVDQLQKMGLDLLNCFNIHQGVHKILVKLNKEQIETIEAMFQKFENVSNESPTIGKALKFAYLIELLVFVNHAFTQDRNEEETMLIPEKLLFIMNYINDNLQNDLSLENIGKKFYINSVYLSFLFKKLTNVNIHEYIIFKRIERAKNLMFSGYNVTEACHLSGFNDYSNFIRTFKKIVGMSPGKYMRQSSQNT